jgi:hypothetical protein
VEPTSVALLALKRATRANLNPTNVAAASKRPSGCCSTAVAGRADGTNGNANALGKGLFPYVACTTLALLACRTGATPTP